MIIVVAYAVYLALSLTVTVWVGRSLHKNGRIFLVDTFLDEHRADAVNALLVTGFYLLNVAFVLLALRLGVKPTALDAAVEFVSAKVGLVLLTLGLMHFFNLYVFTNWRAHVTTVQLNRACDTAAPLGQRFQELP